LEPSWAEPMGEARARAREPIVTYQAGCTRVAKPSRRSPAGLSLGQAQAKAREPIVTYPHSPAGAPEHRPELWSPWAEPRPGTGQGQGANSDLPSRVHMRAQPTGPPEHRSAEPSWAEARPGAG